MGLALIKRKIGKRNSWSHIANELGEEGYLLCDYAISQRLSGRRKIVTFQQETLIKAAFLRDKTGINYVSDKLARHLEYFCHPDKKRPLLPPPPPTFELRHRISSDILCYSSFLCGFLKKWIASFFEAHAIATAQRHWNLKANQYILCCA